MKNTFPPTTLADVRAALKFIDADCDHDVWVKIGMALKSEFNDDEAFLLFEEWLKTGDKYDPDAFINTWISIGEKAETGESITIGTLFFYAKENGYKPGKTDPNEQAIKLPAPKAAKKPSTKTTKTAKAKTDITAMVQKATGYWKASTPDEPHSYATAKGFEKHGLRVSDGWLLVPAYNADNQIQSVQRIKGKKKLNLRGCTITGCYHPIRGDTKKIIVAEGWATGMSINQVTGYAVAVAFGKGNLLRIAVLIRKNHSDAEIIIAADSDHVDTARKAAAACSGSLAVPVKVKGSADLDFNDMHLQHGLKSVTEIFDGELEKPEPKSKGLSETEVEKLLNAKSKPKCLAELQDKFRITNADVKDIKNMKFLYKQALPEGHLIAIVGEPGCGKTTVMEFVCGKIKGDITYINADISQSAMPEAKLRADAGGYTLVIPDQRVGESIESFMAILYELAELGEDLNGKVFVIDTLKKITMMNNKSSAADVYKKLRLLTSRGATVICLGHCLKYSGDQGFPVYEGTADLQADFDELVLLHAVKGDYGEVTTSLYWNEQDWPFAKARAIVQPLSWTIDTENNRKVTELPEWVDTVELGKENRQTLKSADVIIDIYKLLDSTGEMNKGDIVTTLAGSHGKRILRRVLETQTDKFWSVQTGNHNAKLFTAIASAVLPASTVQKLIKKQPPVKT